MDYLEHLLLETIPLVLPEPRHAPHPRKSLSDIAEATHIHVCEQVQHASFSACLPTTPKLLRNDPRMKTPAPFLVAIKSALRNMSWKSRVTPKCYWLDCVLQKDTDPI